MSFFHFQWRLSYFPLDENFKKRSHFDTQWKNHIRREGKASTTTTSIILFVCFALHEHLTRARVFHGLEIVYCFSASSLLSFVVCFPIHVEHFPNIVPSPLAQRVRAAQQDAFVSLYVAVSRWVVGVLRNCFLSIAIVLQLQLGCRRKETKRTKWMMLRRIIMDNFKR